MGKYDFILFDADNTLFDFDKAEKRAIRLTLEDCGWPFDPVTEGLYLAINRALWRRFDQRQVSQEWLVVERFAVFQRVMGGDRDPAEINRFYLDRLAEGAYLLPGADELCQRLKGDFTLAIVTNGVARVQRQRLARSPLWGVIPHLFISEEIGASKPQRAFFDTVTRTMGIGDPRRAVVVGDNLLTDVKGGLDAGMDAVWFNPGGLPNRTGVRPTCQVDSFAALEAALRA